jgi:hypothetical protein
MSPESKEDRDADILELARSMSRLEELRMCGKTLPALLTELSGEIDDRKRQLDPTDEELQPAIDIAAREHNERKNAEQNRMNEEQFGLLSNGLDRINETLKRIESAAKKKEESKGPAAITDQSRVSWIALCVTAFATLLVSAILVLPFLYLLMRLPVSAPEQTRTIEVSLDIAALVAAILGGGGIAAAGIAYAAGQLRIGPKKGPPEGGPETTVRRDPL